MVVKPGSWSDKDEMIQVELMAFHLHQQKRLMRFMSTRGDNRPTLLSQGHTSAKLKPAVLDQWLHDLPPLGDLEKIQRCEDHTLRHYYRAQAELERLRRRPLGEKATPPLVVEVNG